MDIVIFIICIIFLIGLCFAMSAGFSAAGYLVWFFGGMVLEAIIGIISGYFRDDDDEKKRKESNND